MRQVKYQSAGGREEAQEHDREIPEVYEMPWVCVVLSA
jgi:hypothetical protein